MSMRSFVVLVCLAAGAACTRDPESARRNYLQRAETLVQAGKYADAIITFQNALQIRPGDAATHRRLGEVFLKADRPAQALESFITSADLQPENRIVQREVAWMLLRAGDFPRAQERAETLLRVDASDGEALLVRAYAVSRIRGADAGIAAVGDLLALDPDNTRARSLEGWLQLERGHLADARTAIERAAALAPASPEVQAARGVVAWADGRRPDAEAAFRAALAADPRAEVPNRAMATLLIASGRAPEAEPFVRAAQAASPYRGGLLAASWLRALDRGPEARALLEDLSRSERAPADATAHLAAMDAADGRLDQALARVRQTTAQGARPEWLLLEGRLLLAVGQAGAAVPVLDRASSLAGDHPRYVFWRGMAARATGDAARATLLFDRAASGAPLVSVLAQQRAEMALEAGDPSRALAIATEALRRTDEAALRVVRARAERLTGDARAAARTLAPLVTAQTLPAAGHLELGYLAARDSRDAEAAQSFERAMADAAVRSEAVGALVEVHARHGRGADVDRLLATVAHESGLDARTHAALAQGYLRLGRAAEGEAAARAGIAAGADTAAVRTVLALARYAQGAVDDARDEYRRALERDPHYGVAANNLAWLELERGDAESAYRLALTARDAMGERPEVLHTLGLAYLRKGQPDKAAEVLDTCVRRAPARTRYRLDLAEALLEAGQLRESERAMAAMTGALDGEAISRREAMRRRIADQRAQEARAH